VGPLAGLRIVELGGIGPGPFASMLFSEMGAEVLRVTRLPSAGEGVKGFDKQHRLLSRGRRAVAMDLKNPRAIALADRRRRCGHRGLSAGRGRKVGPRPR
jgi:alpha-methylacyl-CoA racemase